MKLKSTVLATAVMVSMLGLIQTDSRGQSLPTRDETAFQAPGVTQYTGGTPAAQFGDMSEQSVDGAGNLLFTASNGDSSYIQLPGFGDTPNGYTVEAMFRVTQAPSDGLAVILDTDSNPSNALYITQIFSNQILGASDAPEGLYDFNNGVVGGNWTTLRYAVPSGGGPATEWINGLQMPQTVSNAFALGGLDRILFGFDSTTYTGQTELAYLKVDTTGAYAPTTPPGDINGDGKVNLTDYGILTSNFLQNPSQGAFTGGDLNDDGVVNLQDFGLFKQDYNAFNGIGGGGSGTSVPEPATLVLTVAVLPAYLLMRRRTRQPQ